MNNIGKIIEFRSDAFPPDVEDQELVNSHCMHGHALATYIGEQLAQRGFAVSRYVAEDWGWYCEVDNPEFSLWYGVSSIEEHCFLIQFHPNRPQIRRWLKKIDVSHRIAELQDAVFAILLSSNRKPTDPLWIEA